MGGGAFGWLEFGEYALEEVVADEIHVPIIPAGTVLYPPTVLEHFDISVPFIAATTTVFELTLADGAPRRLSQLPAEVLYAGDPDARLSQLAIEVMYSSASTARLSQLAAEVLYVGNPAARLGHYPVEVVHRNLRENVIVVIWE